MAETDFNLESLAAYLHLTPSQVTRLADRGRIPGRKVGGSWRFSGREIHHWLEERIGLFDEEHLDHVEGVLERSAKGLDESPISIPDLMPIEVIAQPLQARTRGGVINSMAELAAETGLLWDASKMAEAVRAREDMQPTAFEGGFALLHPRRPMPDVLGDAVLALGVTSTGIPFGGSGGAMTDVFFLVASVDDRGHLRTLARLSRLITGSTLLKDIRGAADASAIRELIVARDEEVD